MTPITPSRTNTIEGELHQIRGYVESTNIRIRYLEQLLEPSAFEQVSKIKAELEIALHNLETIQQRVRPTLPAVNQVTQDVGRAYKRLQKLESRLWSSQSEETARNEGAGQSAATSERPGEEDELLAADTRETWLQSSTPIDEEEQECMMTGAMPVSRPATHCLYEGVRRPTRGRQTNGFHTPEDAAYETHIEVNQEPPGLDRSYTCFSLASRSSRTDVMRELLEEEFAGPMTRIHDPDRVRQGSTSGWQCAQDIMCGVDDSRSVRPKLSFLKIHEVKALKTWLADKGYRKVLALR